jgi:hypothetical protein
MELWNNGMLGLETEFIPILISVLAAVSKNRFNPFGTHYSNLPILHHSKS